ncbi:MAG TPA: hypothetical protein VJW77_14875 [Terriglobia bacterium]|nr:hypothetical protein [Terriglobia bacterium]
MKRRLFLKYLTALTPMMGAENLAALRPTAASSGPGARLAPGGKYKPGRITNEYVHFLPGEKEALQNVPKVLAIDGATVRTQHEGLAQTLKVSQEMNGWQLVAVLPWLNGVPTAVFEKHVTHQGAISYVTEEGEIAHIPKRVGDLSKIRPRPVNPPKTLGELKRPRKYVPGPDVYGNYILESNEDPCYENVAALGPEFIGWTLVANGDTGPEGAMWLEPDGTSRGFGTDPQSLWAPDMTGTLLEPPDRLEYLYNYVDGYSKRTAVGGYLPAADIGVWNPTFRVGYEVMAVLSQGNDAKPVGRIRVKQPEGTEFVEYFWNGSREAFFSALVGVWNQWRHFFEDRMKVEIPDPWLLDGARAGIALSRASYRGLNPTYQIGEGAYTKIPERSHALFPVAHYEFVWAHQLWNLTDEVEPYFEHYLENYVLPDGNFLYNTQDQVEAPLNAGVFLENSARAYDYTGDLDALRKRLPVLKRMIDFVLKRYAYSKETFPPADPRHGLIWGSPEADNGDPRDDYPNSHPYYYQNAAWTWRGLVEHARCLNRAGQEHHDADLQQEAKKIAGTAAGMRALIERSLKTVLARRNPEMKQADITPFTPFDTDRKPTDLTSYENHRYMMDWWTSDWGDAALDRGHFIHRKMAGEQILGLNTDGASVRTSNFMSHGTLAYLIRQDDYRPFLLTLYALACYTMDSGSRYSPEDTYLPGGHPGEGSRYGWSAVVNSELQLALGLRWLLCYEEHDHPVVHLQKAAPKHWFAAGETIRVENCPTRFGHVSWATESFPGLGSSARWRCRLKLEKPLEAGLIIHIHTPDGQTLKSSSMGKVLADRVELSAATMAGKTELRVNIE